MDTTSDPASSPTNPPDSTRKLFDGLGCFVPSVDSVPTARRLLAISRQLDIWRDKVEESQLIQLTEEVSDDMLLLELALDLIGVPQEHLPDVDRGKKFDRKKHFSRDIYRRLYEVTVYKHNDPDTFLKVATGERIVADTWNDEDQLERLIYGRS